MFLKPWQSYIYLLFLHPAEVKFLAIFQENTCGLPQIKIEQKIEQHDLITLEKLINSHLNISVNVLDSLDYHISKQQRQVTITCLVEPKNSGGEFTIGFWCDRQMLKTLFFGNSNQKSLVEQYLIPRPNNLTFLIRPPWAFPGWFSDVSAWIETQLDNLGYQLIAPIEYVKNWSISCVLKVKTTTGNLYFKEAANLPLFCNEPLVTAQLDRLFPQQIPTVIAINPHRHWLLLKDFGTPLTQKRSLKFYKNLYQEFARLQIKAIEHRDLLLQTGCLDRRLVILQAQIAPLASDRNIISNLSSEERARLPKIVPILQNFCDRLASYKIPETLVHGDLHLGNVALNQDSYLFFDWTDACITHPFFDCLALSISRKNKSWWGYLDNFWQRQKQDRLRDAYLNQWQEYESTERLLEAWNIAKTLCVLHHAITYQQIVINLEAKNQPQFSEFLSFLLRTTIGMAELSNSETTKS